MKRLLVSLALVATFVSMTGCGQKQQAEPAAEAPAESTAVATPPADMPPAIDDDAVREIDQFIVGAGVDKSVAGWKTMLPKPPQATFDKAHSYFARMVTNKGTILIRFLPGTAPMHVGNFIYLARLGFYDDMPFHRVIPGFMAQGGCPVGNGTGNPGYSFEGEFSDAVKHDKAGRLSMANAGPGTDGSQFFLTFVATPHLDGAHTVFGQVVEGMDVLQKIEAGGTRSGGPKEPLRMEKVTIEVK
jgi:cyclophilin family peptidyl-prolyl cis-trans isomerase/predicted small lipoprotein YifL